MKIYRIKLFNKDDDGESRGFVFRETMREVRQLRDESPQCSVTVEEIDVRFTKAGVVEALNLYASHPDNG